jgi:2'-5' RNA ligase
VILHRTFIAVELDPTLQEAAARLQERLRADGAQLRWVRPHNLHFTLRFLGEIPAAQLARACVAVRESAAAVSPFAVELGGLGAFPNFERPQVVWIGSLRGGEDLERLAAVLNAALGRQGFPGDARAFRPHLTLGRARDDRRWGDLVRALQLHRDEALGRQDVRQVAVMESRLTPDGPIYTPREQVPLAHGLN